MSKRVNQSVEIFHNSQYPGRLDADGEPLLEGWYYVYPDDPDAPIGVFESRQDAIDDYETESDELFESDDQPDHY